MRGAHPQSAPPLLTQEMLLEQSPRRLRQYSMLLEHALEVAAAARRGRRCRGWPLRGLSGEAQIATGRAIDEDWQGFYAGRQEVPAAPAVAAGRVAGGSGALWRLLLLQGEAGPWVAGTNAARYRAMGYRAPWAMHRAVPRPFAAIPEREHGRLVNELVPAI